MENIININHSFLRKEVDNSIVLILDYQSEWKDKEINFKLTNDILEISLENGQVKWNVKLNNELLINSLKNYHTAVIIGDENGGMVEGIINPLGINKKNKP